MCGCAVMLLAACSAVTDDYGEENTVTEVSKRYINLAIAVTNNTAVTRATPLGGENGNGREAGFLRENAITGITLMLYQDATGINTTLNPVIDFVAFYPVTRGDYDNAGTTYTGKGIEAYYTTGNQLVPHNTIDFTKTYRAIVVANADLTSSVTAGTSHLNDLRTMTLSSIYSGDETKPAAQCGNFVMSSEQDQTLNFTTSTNSRDAAGDYYYDLTTQALVIERMAARIDFWAVGGTYNADKSGYVYDVTGSSSDKFVVKAIMPFNLTNKHTASAPADAYGNEYLLKRLTPSVSSVTTQWLVSEGPYDTDPTYYYVLDPKTTAKVTAEHPSLVNSLESVKDLSETAFANSSYRKSITAMHSSIASSGGYASLTDGALTGEDVIVAYPMENTLLPESPLYYNATGIAIEGWYYEGGITHDTNPQRYVYYGYLRHQGEETSYDITTSNNTEALSSATMAMNIGIVRNNIYRVWIGSIDSKRNMTLRIVVKQWDQFTHSTIYM